jgi:hypothetical protein
MKITRLFLLAPLLLAACSGDDVQSTLGMDRSAPDEFVVYSRPPLSVPPEFDLQPPRPGQEGPAHVSSEDVAREALLGTKAQPASLDEAAAGVNTNVDTAVTPILSSDAPTGAESSFLSKAGIAEADPDIRTKLSQDVVVEPKKKKKAQSLYERMVGEESNEPVVDAKKEAERLRTNRDAGKPVTEGETPVKDTKPQSVIDRIF